MSVIKFMKDGDKWCAMPPGFVDIQESEAGFGDTPEQAEIHLLLRLYKLARSGFGCPHRKCAHCDEYGTDPKHLPVLK